MKKFIRLVIKKKQRACYQLRFYNNSIVFSVNVRLFLCLLLCTWREEFIRSSNVKLCTR